MIRNIPNEIYLITGLDKGELFDIDCFNDLHELSWSTTKQFYHDIKYVLASQPVQLVNWDELTEKIKPAIGSYDNDLVSGIANRVINILKKEL